MQRWCQVYMTNRVTEPASAASYTPGVTLIEAAWVDNAGSQTTVITVRMYRNWRWSMVTMVIFNRDDDKSWFIRKQWPPEDVTQRVCGGVLNNFVSII